MQRVGFNHADNLLGKNSVIDELVNDLDDSNWEEVEVVGWLYQFYNSEVKESVGGLKNNAVSKRYLPTVTQLFTPKWIVKYMLQNSLGKLYMSLYPNSKIYEQWEYYLTKDEEPSKIVPEHIAKVEDITLIDPACGSGHILIEALTYSIKCTWNAAIIRERFRLSLWKITYVVWKLINVQRRLLIYVWS